MRPFKIIESMKKRYNLRSTNELWIIMFVFSLAGMATVWIRKPVFHLLGIADTTPWLVRLLAWLVIVVPFYQINLLVFGFLLGKFYFFWEKEKRFWRFVCRVRQNT